ncbi:MAG: aldose epimerase family protein [Tannerellaceae bacterium]
MNKLCMAVMAVCMLLSCGEKGEKKEEATLSGLMKSDFVSTVEGKETALYILKNKNGAEACITNYGGRLVSVMVPDREGKMTDVVLGYDKIADYLASDGNFGALIGRYGNRIAQGKFTLDSVEYELPHNDNGHCLHGGPAGYHAQMWDAKQLNDQTLELTYLSKDGEAGFPGNLNIKVTYTLTDDNAVDIRYDATTDKPTVVNLTNHSYFNLSGKPGSQVLDQLVMINADTYTPVDSLLIPTAAIDSVAGTPLDLRQLVALGAHIDEPFDQLIKGHGYDHNWVLNAKGDINQLAAKANCPSNGITLEVYTNEPGIQLYTGNFLSGANKGKQGTIYPHRGAFCLETQHYPDTPNHPTFPTTVLRPGEQYMSHCIYKFTVE